MKNECEHVGEKLDFGNYKYCFAHRGTECTALNDLYCVTQGYCPFYKDAAQYSEELLKYNGTANLGQVLEAYKKAKNGA